MAGYTKDLFHEPSADQMPAWRWYQLRRGRKVEDFLPPAGVLPTLEQVADSEFLIATFHDMARSAGKAPGPDGLSFRHFSPREVCAAARAVSESLRAGTYRPRKARKVLIPKKDDLPRELRLRNLFDRVVARALYLTLCPYFETVFDDCSHGFRPRRSTWTLLAALERAAAEEGRWVLAVDDVYHAFDSVVIAHSVADFAEHIPNHALLRLIEVVERGGDDSKAVGVATGCPFSPLALNLRLHVAHDRALAPVHHDPPRFRYADNLGYLTRSVPEGLQTLSKANDLLGQAALTLKGKDGPPVDLRAGAAHFLGFTVTAQGKRLRLGVHEDAWDGLAEGLEKALLAEDPNRAARSAVLGWVQAHGPAFLAVKGSNALPRVLKTAATFGFREVSTPEELKSAWRGAWQRWLAARKAAGQPAKGPPAV